MTLNPITILYTLPYDDESHVYATQSPLAFAVLLSVLRWDHQASFRL